MQEPSKPRFRFLKLKRRRVRYVALLPTLLTLANGVCGFLAILEIGRGLQGKDPVHFHWAGYLILIAMIFDALDGKVARVTRTATSFGAQLDSLSDLVTFGVAPGFLVYGLNVTGPELSATGWSRVVLVVSTFYAMCALMRLARFTVETAPDEKSHEDFSGLPSPAAAGMIASAVIPWNAFPEWPVLNALAEGVTRALPVIAFLLGLLMVSRIRYAHVVNRLFMGFRPFVRLVELGIVALLVVIFHEVAVFLAFGGYVLTGPALWARYRLFPRKAGTASTATDPSTPPEDSAFF